jgi:hypothetical protein
MRCQKCGYHSFDYLDACKKCGAALTGQKLRFRFQGYVAPAPFAAGAEADPKAPALPAEAEAESEANDFGYPILEKAGGKTAEEVDLPAIAGQIEVELDVDNLLAIDLAADSGLSLDQPFDMANENLPDAPLPKLDDRFNF